MEHGEEADQGLVRMDIALAAGLTPEQPTLLADGQRRAGGTGLGSAALPWWDHKHQPVLRAQEELASCAAPTTPVSRAGCG